MTLSHDSAKVVKSLSLSKMSSSTGAETSLSKMSLTDKRKTPSNLKSTTRQKRLQKQKRRKPISPRFVRLSSQPNPALFDRLLIGTNELNYNIFTGLRRRRESVNNTFASKSTNHCQPNPVLQTSSVDQKSAGSRSVSIR
jgi:hypothetical protein